MKKTWLVILGMVSVLLIVGLGGCYTGKPLISDLPSELQLNLGSQQHGIWVNGTGEVIVDPDIATLQLGVDAQSTNVADAQLQATEAMEKIKDVLTDNGIAEKDIQTQHFSIQQVTKWDRDNEEQIITGYRVTRTVAVKIRDIDNTGAIIDAVARAGGDLTRIQGISFSVDDPSAYFEEAREDAIANAEDKAEQLAELSGVKLGNPTYISESTPYQPPVYKGDFYQGAVQAPAPAMETSISPGEMKITLTVQVAYSIEN